MFFSRRVRLVINIIFLLYLFFVLIIGFVNEYEIIEESRCCGLYWVHERLYLPLQSIKVYYWPWGNIKFLIRNIIINFLPLFVFTWFYLVSKKNNK